MKLEAFYLGTAVLREKRKQGNKAMGEEGSKREGEGKAGSSTAGKKGSREGVKKARVQGEEKGGFRLPCRNLWGCLGGTLGQGEIQSL